MPTFALALGLVTALAGADAPVGHADDGLLIRVQAGARPENAPAPGSAPGSAPAAAPPPAAAPIVPPAQAAMPFTQGQLPGQAPPAPAIVYQGPPGQALSDPAIEARINAQIEALFVPPNGGFTVQRYVRSDPGGNVGSGANGSPSPMLAGRNGLGGGNNGSGGYGSVGSGAMQQAGYAAPGGSGFGNPQSGMQGPSNQQGGFGSQGFGAQGFGPQGGGSGQNGGFPGSNAGQGGYPGQNGFQGQAGGGGQGGYGQGGYGQSGYGQGGSGYGGNGQFGGQFGPGGGRPSITRYAVARAGDTVFATLDQGYNSDDPQAPIFATIYDVDSAREPGPLNGVRLIGQIVYSSNQAAIQFTQMVLLDGRQFPLKAYAISARDARTGVSNDVDEHTFERYAGLFAATLIQGAGQAGQLLLQTNRNVVVDPATGLALSQPGGGVRTQAALAALLPLGQAATAIGAQNFNKPATIAGAPGFGIGVVFLEPPALPRDAIFGGRGTVYRGSTISRLN